jgi:hypothetical protein
MKSVEAESHYYLPCIRKSKNSIQNVICHSPHHLGLLLLLSPHFGLQKGREYSLQVDYDDKSKGLFLFPSCQIR